MTIFTPRPQWVIDLINELAGDAGGVWGSITGTLSAQTDLQTALNSKLDDSQATAFGLSLLGDVNATAARSTLGLGTVATLASDADTTLAADSDTKIATQKAVKAYVDANAGGFSKGSSLPVSPSSGDLHFHTTEAEFIQYDGTRWLSVTKYNLIFDGQTGLNVSAILGRLPHPCYGTYDIYLTRASWYGVVNTAGNWTMNLYKYEGATPTLIIGETISSTTRVAVTEAINQTVTSAFEGLEVEVAENSGTATFTGGAIIEYRKIFT
jgi:hypothetical protein